MRRARVVLCALAVVVGVGLSGCGLFDRPPPEKPVRTLAPPTAASSPSADPATVKNSEGCRLLTPKERRSLAGENLETVVPVPPIKDVLLCKWVKTLSSPVTTAIRVISQPVQTWARTLPTIIDSRIASKQTSDALTDRLQTAKRQILRGTDDISDKRACSYFSLLLEVSDKKKKGQVEALAYQGTANGDFTVGWQRCGEGVHTELIYEEPGLQVSPALGQSVIRLGKIAHGRAVKKLQ